MIINVTKEHIDKGKRVNNKRCPVALALAEQTGFPFIQVFLFAVNLAQVEGGASVNFEHTKKLEKFISDFDKGKPVKHTRFLIKGLKRYARHKAHRHSN